MELKQGEKRSLADLAIGIRCEMDVEFAHGVDIAAFGLGADRRIGDDRYVVLFSNPASPDGAIRLNGARFDLNLDLLPAAIDRIVFTATHDEKPISQAKPLRISIDGGKARFDVGACLTAEKAVMMCEIYRHKDGWRIGTIGAGFEGGLAKLVEHFGGQVGSPAPAPAPSTSPSPAAPPAPEKKPISLSKITLEKSRPSISLEKKGDSFGEIVLNLNWNQRQTGGLFAKTQSVDLDLGVLFEMQDGRKGIVQALGNTFGDFSDFPWIALSGDDRTGTNANGETIRINGRHFDKIKRLGVFALIYEGAVNWQQTDGVVRMTLPGQPEIEVRMDEGKNAHRVCGISIIDNVGGKMEVRRHMSYYPNQQPFADEIGIRLNWTTGTKD